jgi:hypothetical protein
MDEGEGAKSSEVGVNFDIEKMSKCGKWLKERRLVLKVRRPLGIRWRKILVFVAEESSGVR